MVKQYNAEDLPKVRELAKSEDPDKNHPYVGTDGLDNYQNVKSSTFPIPSDWSANKYYYRVKVTVPSTTPGAGTDLPTTIVMLSGTAATTNPKSST